MDNIASFLGLAKKAGKLAIGEEPVGSACRAKKASLVLLAADSAVNTVRRAAHFSEIGGVPSLTLPLDKGQVGLAVGRASCAMLALTDIGMAASLAKKLALAMPDRYGMVPDLLNQKAAKALQRQKEKRAHEKNLLRGKKKPWAAPPEKV